MMIHRETGVIFKNRRDAVIIMGEARYNRFLSQGEFEFVDNPNHWKNSEKKFA